MSQLNRARSPYGSAGVVLGAIAVFVTVMHVWIGPFSEPQTLEEALTEIAGSIRSAVSELGSGQSERQSWFAGDWTADRFIEVGTVAAGLLAVLLAMLAFAAREDLRLAGSAAVLGAAAVAVRFLVATG